MDGNGISDDKDACLGTPTGVVIDPQACPLDSDEDDITDNQDQCLDTPMGAS